MNALVYVNIDQVREKNKVTQNEKWKKLHGFSYDNQPKKVFVQRRPLVRNNILIRNDIVNFDLFYLLKYENNLGMSRPIKPFHLKAAQAI